MLISHFFVILHFQAFIMKRTVQTIITLFILTMFLVYSSGLKITVHHCCHKHHHEANDHRHCTEDTYLFKITDQYDSDHSVKKFPTVTDYSSTTDFCPDNIVKKHYIEPCIECCHCLFHAVRRCIFNIISQLIL